MEVFSALADPTRRSILEMLAQEGPLSVAEIGQRFVISLPAISQHLKILREANLVHMEKRGQQRIYSVNPGAVRDVESWARLTAQRWQQRFDALETLLAEEQSHGKDD